ncbi:MAG: hypothetical protein HZA31_02100 [Opitutae bacterium]|nr:hypothetical protein [Opitutae bacterium]
MNLLPTAWHRRFSAFLFLSVTTGTLAFAEPATAATLAEGAIRNLGPQLSSRTLQASSFTRDAAGRDIVCAIVRSQPAARFIVADVATGELLHSHSLPGANGGWGAATATDGSVYLGTESNCRLFRYLPEKDQIEELGAPTCYSAETFIWNVAAGRDGEVFGGTSPGCRLFRYAPNSGFQDLSSGPVVEGENYVRAVACDTEAGLLYAGIGVKIPHVVEFNLRTQQRRELLPLDYAPGQTAYSISIVGERLFVMLDPSHRTIVLNRRTLEIEASFATTGLYQIVSPASPYDGAVYYVGAGKLHRYDIAQRQSAAVAGIETAPAFAYRWLRFGEESWLVFFNQAGELVRLHPPSGRFEKRKVESPEQPLVIQSLATGADGRIWIGGYLASGAAVYNPETDRSEQFKGIGQAERIVAVGDQIFFGTYPQGRVIALDPARPWNLKEKNPRVLGHLAEQSRPMAMVAVPEVKKLYVGCIPEYGILTGGGLGICDLATGRLTCLPNFVDQQSVVSLTYAQGLVVGGTTVAINLGTQPATREAKLFLYDPVAGKIVFETVPVPGKAIVTALMPGPDGHVWGVAEGTLFGFDVAQRRVVFTQPLLTPNFSGRAMWQDATMVLHPNGQIYLVEDGGFYRLDPRTKQLTWLHRTGNKIHTRPLTLDHAGRLYFTDGMDLWQFTPDRAR